MRELIMWLPKDERKLLSLYYKQIGEPARQEFIAESDLVKTLSPKCGAQGIEGVPEYSKSKSRVAIANKVLSGRKLVQYREAGDSIEVSLTMEGHDLGRKYASWFDRSGLWFEEYKNHWIWIIVSFFGGVIGALLINWLSR
jgi:hypothetical protein